MFNYSDKEYELAENKLKEVITSVSVDELVLARSLFILGHINLTLNDYEEAIKYYGQHWREFEIRKKIFLKMLMLEDLF